VTTSPADQLLHLALPCDRTAPGLARNALRTALGPGRTSDDAALVVSELVTNAVRHSGCAPDQTVMLDALITGQGLRISVHDAGRSVRVPVVRDDPPSVGGGLGLRLVEQLARRWGSERPDGRLVWAELAL
jgi:anti-sigma regulatory factor (Ser/Thr protein kinase)